MKLKVGDRVKLTGELWNNNVRNTVVTVDQQHENGAFWSGNDRVRNLTSPLTGEQYQGYEFEIVKQPKGSIAQRTPEGVAQRVLDEHCIKDHWVRTGNEIRKLIAEGVRLDRQER